jgi:hypothetical protein
MKAGKVIIMSKTSTLSTTLSSEAKTALSKFCLKRGLKINHFLEEIIWDRLEEEMDSEIARNTDLKGLTSLSDLRKQMKL